MIVEQPRLHRVCKKNKKNMQPLQNCYGHTIRIGQEILCLPYAGFLILTTEIFPTIIFVSE